MNPYTDQTSKVTLHWCVDVHNMFIMVNGLQSELFVKDMHCSTTVHIIIIYNNSAIMCMYYVVVST